MPPTPSEVNVADVPPSADAADLPTPAVRPDDADPVSSELPRPSSASGARPGRSSWNVDPARTGVLERLVTGPVDAVPDRDAGTAIRHRAEYWEPSIWIWRRIVGVAFAFILVTLAWYLVKIPDGLVSDDTLPTQTQVAAAFNEVRSDGFAGATLSRHAGLSLYRLVFGLGIGALAGSILGLLAGSAPLARTVVDPVTSLARMVPALAVAPLLVLWLGAGEVALVGVVALTVALSTMATASEARARSLRGLLVDVPQEVFGGMRSALAVGWAAVLAVETVMAPAGLGPLIWSAQSRSDVLVVGVYVVGLMGFVLDTALRALHYVVVNRRSVEG
jgi:ABC-type nitrate/sulfonate/bicarbonate transport system permease component